ncbi:SugE protein [Xanthomonas fragariae]|uniref:Quaternary ammonium compound-resistance protein SugE n=1 Tax=Xanthomonas fragariae TaxID=48664 RepID=A0A1Y6H377_9XANT|nr:Quaternary ammonium compound-resistance protein SugE [Xanthomonas fragariae]SMR04962.1 SugE protein [Xanthomonas fragariae]
MRDHWVAFFYPFSVDESGIGALGVTTAGIALFGDCDSWSRLACVGLIVAGVIGLKLVS